jgi:hypothetical protein
VPLSAAGQVQFQQHHLDRPGGQASEADDLVDLDGVGPSASMTVSVAFRGSAGCRRPRGR